MEISVPARCYAEGSEEPRRAEADGGGGGAPLTLVLSPKGRGRSHLSLPGRG
jgi:hypothetical protein